MRQPVYRTRVGLWLYLSACTVAPEDTGPDEVVCPPLAVEVGTGERGWEPLAEGDGLELFHGPQGGWHLLSSVRVTGDADVVHLRLLVTLTDDEAVVSEGWYTVALAPDEGDACIGTYWGMYALLDVTRLVDGDLDTPPELLVGRQAVVRVELEDDAGATAAGEAHVVVMDDEP